MTKLYENAMLRKAMLEIYEAKTRDPENQNTAQIESLSRFSFCWQCGFVIVYMCKRNQYIMCYRQYLDILYPKKHVNLSLK